MAWQTKAGLRIAIDGPSGSGKGTIAAMLGRALALPVLDTGLLYRYLGWQAAEKHVSLDDEQAVLAVIPAAMAAMSWQAEGIFFEQEDCTSLLRGEDAGLRASKVAAMPEVRRVLLDVQREIARLGCVMDGRDIGTVVLVDAEAKFFLTASMRERVRRRWAQLNDSGHDVALGKVAEDLKSRDERDMARACAPLEQAVDAIRIDSTTMQMDDVVDRILTVLQRRNLITKTA